MSETQQPQFVQCPVPLWNALRQHLMTGGTRLQEDLLGSQMDQVATEPERQRQIQEYTRVQVLQAEARKEAEFAPRLAAERESTAKAVADGLSNKRQVDDMLDPNGSIDLNRIQPASHDGAPVPASVPGHAVMTKVPTGVNGKKPDVVAAVEKAVNDTAGRVKHMPAAE